MMLSMLLGLLLNDFSNAVTEPVAEPPAIVNFQELPHAEDRPPILTPTKIIKDGKESLGVEISARSAIIVDVHSGKVLFEKNNQEKNSIASLTKLMTALTFIDYNPGWEKQIEMAKSDERNGATAHIYRGETVTVKDLFYTSLIGSDNNSTIALTRAAGLDIDTFVNEMNKKAEQLGLKDTVFTDPTGLDEGNISTPFDISKLIFHALNIPEIETATSKSSYLITIQNKNLKRTIYSTDLLLNSYINKSYSIRGGKTGFTPKAGACLGIQVEDKDKNDIIVVVMGSRDLNSRFHEVKALTQWAFNNYTWE